MEMLLPVGLGVVKSGPSGVVRPPLADASRVPWNLASATESLVEWRRLWRRIDQPHESRSGVASGGHLHFGGCSELGQVLMAMDSLHPNLPECDQAVEQDQRGLLG
jgi:hypothetical protein